MEGLECKKENFIVNTEVDWKPMELFEHRSDMVCGCCGVLEMIRAAEFWTSCNLLRDFCGRPYRRELQ